MRSMRNRLILTFALALALGADAQAAPADQTATGSAGCRASGLAPGDYERTLTHGGWTRTYRLHVPPSYRAGMPAPLLLNLHGGGGNAAQQERMSGLSAKADSEGFILVTPDGIPSLVIRSMETWNAGNCCGRAKRVTADDVGFVRSIIDAVSAELCVDPRRVYATGLSKAG